MKIFRLAQYAPLNAPEQISSNELTDDAEILHFESKNDYEGWEESTLGTDIQGYDLYDLKLISIDWFIGIDSREDVPYEIDDYNVDDYKELILKNKTYPPIITNILGHIIDGHHRALALKELGVKHIWAYVPNKDSKVENKYDW